VKVLLDGEPVVGAVAASVGEGWVLVQPEPELEPVKCNSRAPLGLAYRIDPFLAPVKRTGVVTLVEPGGSPLPSSKEGRVPAAAAVEVAEKIVRDVRIDQMGFVAELVKQHADVLKTKVKVRMLDDEIDRVTGDYFEGLLVRGKTRTLDPKKLFKLVKSKQITEEQFLGAVSVKLPAASSC
jgi:hypothetical protein